MKVRAVWQFFEAEAEGDALHLFAPGAKEPLHTFRFRQATAGRFSLPERLCFAAEEWQAATTWRFLW